MGSILYEIENLNEIKLKTRYLFIYLIKLYKNILFFIIAK